MTAIDRQELDAIRRVQEDLHEGVRRLDLRIDRFAGQLRAAPSPAPRPRPLSAERTVVPPPLPRPSPAGEKVAAPIPQPVIDSSADSKPAATVEAPPSSSSAVRPPPGDGGPKPDESLEVRVGTYWMSRVGIVLLLTGLVFLGNYAYHRIVPLLGAAGKLSLLALASSVLLGLGAWLERSREATRNFGRVLLAGGAAALYYTGYAAHFVSALRVIESPLLGGGLLLALTGAFVAAADRRRSEAVAMPALLLASYTSALNPIGSFTLFSNLLLAAGALFLLVRHGWTRLSFLSLAATYGSFAFWRYETGAAAAPPLLLGLGFLGLYWIFFTMAAFAAPMRALESPTRIGFLTANNGALFALGALHFHAHAPQHFWAFAIFIGGTLIALAEFAARWKGGDRALEGACLAQGLALVTTGLCARLTGPRLAVVLAIESSGLLVVARARQRLIGHIGAGLCALGATLLALLALWGGERMPLAVGGPVAALLFFNAWWAKRRGAAEFVVAHALFAWMVVGVLIWRVVPPNWQPGALAAPAVVALAALRLRLPEVMWLGQGFLGVALVNFLVLAGGLVPQPWWSPTPLIVIALGLMHWWLSPRRAVATAELRSLLACACAAVAAICGAVWMHAFWQGDAWLVGTSGAALMALIYAAATRAWPVAVTGQLFTALSLFAFGHALIAGANRWAALFPVANLFLSSLLCRRWAAHPSMQNAAIPLAPVASAGQVLAAALLGAWAFVHVPEEWRTFFFALSGAVQIVAGAATAVPVRRHVGAVYAVAAFALFWSGVGEAPRWMDAVAIVLVPASLRVARRLCGRVPVLAAGRDLLVAVAVASGWLWVTRWLVEYGQAAHLTAGWAVFALVVFAAGLGLRERIYRLAGFAVLALAIGRLFVFEVWRFDTLGRIASFLVLGVVLLLLSFVYHRLAEAMRRWL